MKQAAFLMLAYPEYYSKILEELHSKKTGAFGCGLASLDILQAISFAVMGVVK